MANLLQLTLFGSPGVRRHDQLVTGFRSSKAQALLYYLAVTGRPHTRPTLAGLLWGDQPEGAARVSLSKCLSNLRDLGGEAVLVDRQTVAFNRDHPYDLDTERFMAGVGQPPTSETISSLQADLALYRGDFLEGFYIRDAPDFEQWLLVQRAHYREAVVQGLHTLANYTDQQGDLPQAITHTCRLLSLEPWREEAHRQLMTRLARSGQRGAALAQFETCRRILDEELAVEPDTETMAVLEAIRIGVFEKTLAPPSQTILQPASQPTIVTLPLPPTPLIGREQELAELGDLLRHRQCRLITIVGPGGIGKTRLALALATAQSKGFRHGAVFVPLAAISDPAFLPQAILQALAQPLQAQQAPDTQLLDYLHDKEYLLLLDNYEQLLPEIALLTALLTRTRSVTLLVTSRERLALQAEQLFSLEGLSYPQANETAPLAEFAAMRLFLQRVRQFQWQFIPSDEEMAAIGRICRLAEGMPLALELTANAVRLQPLPVLADALAQGEQPPTTHTRDRPARHASLAAAFEHSWQLLTPPEQQAFCQLSVFRAGFTLNAGQAVSGAALNVFSGLIDKSLLRQSAEERFELHELLRQYSAAKLAEAGQATAMSARHLQYFLALAEVLETRVIGPPASAALDAFERDHENFRAALRWGLTTPEAEPLQRWQAVWLAARLGRFWYVRHHWNEGRMWLTQALTVVESTQPPTVASEDYIALRAKLLYRAGVFANDQRTAQRMLEQSLALHRRRDDQRAMARCLHELGTIANERGDYALAATFNQESLAHGRALEDAWVVAISLLNLADLAIEEGDFQGSIAYASECLTIFRKLDDVGPIASSLNMLAQAAIGLGDYQQALDRLEESFQIHRQRGPHDKPGPWTLRVLGLVQQMLGNYQEAFSAYRDSLMLRYARAQIGGMAWALEGLGETTALIGQCRRAAVLWGAAAALRQQDGSIMSTRERQRLDPIVTTVRTQLGETAFLHAWAQGEAMSSAQIIAYVLAETTSA